MKNDFTPQAERFWQSVSDRHKTLLLNNVFCLDCGTTTIVRYDGRIEGGNLILEGECVQCGRSVARLVEGG